MKKYALMKAMVEIPYREREKIKGGVSLGRCETPEEIGLFLTPEGALKELDKYTTEVREMSGGAGTYYGIEEYYVEEGEYDEDGEWIDGGDILGFSKMEETA